MSVFFYQARTSSGDVVEGTIDAPTKQQAVTSLHLKELIVLSVRPVEKSFFKGDLLLLFNRPSKKDLIVFTRQLATLIEADVPLLESLSILSQQIEKESLKKIIVMVMGNIEGGASLSVALSEH